MSIRPLPLSGVTLRAVERLADRLEGGVRVGPYSYARPGALLRIVPDIGLFLAREGAKLDYALFEDADIAAAEALIHGGLLAALIHQRGELPLHATTVLAPAGGGALALTGHSGGGKSTTAHELVRRGWRLLADDLTRVTIEAAAPMAWPGRGRLRLMEDACARSGLDASSLEPAPNWPGKYVLDLAVATRAAALVTVAVLDRGPGALRVERLTGASAARALIEHTYRLHYVSALGQARRHLDLVAAAASAVCILRVSGTGDVEAVASAVEAAAT